MTGAAATAAGPVHTGIGPACEHVITGAVLDETAARLARMLDPAFLAGAGWDPASRVLSLPAGHRLLGRVVCRTAGCTTTAAGLGGVCHRCFTRLSGQGMTAEQIAGCPRLPPLQARARRCAVPGCQREPTVTHAVMCRSHVRQFRQRAGRPAIGQFLADPRVRAAATTEPVRGRGMLARR